MSKQSLSLQTVSAAEAIEREVAKAVAEVRREYRQQTGDSTNSL